MFWREIIGTSNTAKFAAHFAEFAKDERIERLKRNGEFYNWC